MTSGSSSNVALATVSDEAAPSYQLGDSNPVDCLEDGDVEESKVSSTVQQVDSDGCGFA